MTSRVAAVAFAASVLFAAPVAADPVRGAITRTETRIVSDTHALVPLEPASYDRYRSHGADDRRGFNQWGQADREVRDLSRDAVQACRRAVRQEARYLGFLDVEFEDGRTVRQVGPRGFFVNFSEVEFEGRRREVETRVSCEVRRGEVLRIDGLPRPRRGSETHAGRR